MFQPGRKSKQFFQFSFPNYIQIFKKVTEDNLAWQYQLIDFAKLSYTGPYLL